MDMKAKDLDYSTHFLQRVEERSLKIDWITEAIDYPDEKVYISDIEIHCYKIIKECSGKWLKVVYNPLNKIIITAHFDRNKK